MLTLYSNFINHHQIPLANEFVRLLGDDFRFIATKPIPQERLDMGYRDENKKYPFIVTTYDSNKGADTAKILATDSDIVIVGSAPDRIMDIRLPTGKLTFHSSERYFKKGMSLRNLPRIIGSSLKHIKKYERYKNYYYLCMSAYTAADVNIFSNYKNRTFKWGYFTEAKEYNIDELFAEKRKNVMPSILWAGRLIRWKHPDASILIAEKLKCAGIPFSLKIIGNGEMEGILHKMIVERNLEDCVYILGAMPPEKVREHMEQADIFLFTSDYNEGWGAVLNESMNSACAVVASHAIGSVPFLIKHMNNGIIYRNGDIDGLYKNVKWLLEDCKLREELGKQAYVTIKETWSPKVAAERFLVLCNALEKGEESPFDDGPCSLAFAIKQKNMYATLIK